MIRGWLFYDKIRQQYKQLFNVLTKAVQINNYVSELSFSFGKTIHGLKVFASSNSKVA